jgi:hypothetical protein
VVEILAPQALVLVRVVLVVLELTEISELVLLLARRVRLVLVLLQVPTELVLPEVKVELGFRLIVTTLMPAPIYIIIFILPTVPLVLGTEALTELETQVLTVQQVITETLGPMAPKVWQETQVMLGMLVPMELEGRADQSF